MNSSFIGKIMYKKERVGIVEKEGKTYVKYVKVSRVRMSKNIKYALLSILILFVLGLGIKLLISEFASRSPVEETVEGIGV